jgi:peptidoglycan/LPS O-acetylase OafA/YrhL
MVIRKSERIVEFDILRALAIILIIFFHIANNPYIIHYLDINQSFISILGLIGLSLFFFMSGFLLQYSYGVIENRADLYTFFRKRITRIYPLYWIFALIIIAVYRLSVLNSVVYLAGIQALLYPKFVDTLIYPFISTILIFYLLFPIINHYSTTVRKLLTISLIPALFFITAITVGGFSSSQVLAYYGVFIVGILAAKLEMYEKMVNLDVKPTSFLSLIVLITIILGWTYSYDAQSHSLILTVCSTNVIGALSALTIFYLVILYVKSSRRVPHTFFFFTAYSSYAVFLLHQPVFDFVGKNLNKMPNLANYGLLILIALIPGLFAVGYLMQNIANKTVDSLYARYSALLVSKGTRP